MIKPHGIYLERRPRHSTARNVGLIRKAAVIRTVRYDDVSAELIAPFKELVFPR